MEKILLGHRDKTPFTDELTASESRLNSVFVALGGFVSNPTLDDLRDVMSGGESVKRRFADSVSETLAGIKIPSLKAEQETRLKQMSGELDDLIGQAVNYRGSLIGFIPDSMIELRDGLVWFSPEADKLIDAACEIYIETDDQMRVYELSRQLAGILNQLQPYITLYRHKTVLDAVTEKDGHWEPNDDLTIDLPARLQRIKEFGNRYSD